MRIGNQDPTEKLYLNHAESRYNEAIELYAKTGRTIQQWQINLLKHIMAINDDGLWTHTKFGWALPRRNGKNEILAIIELWALEHGLMVLHTAHRTTTTRMAWERLAEFLDMSRIDDYDSLRAIGRENIARNGGRVEFRTRSSKGGLGEGYDLLIIDEAQEYTTDQESALKYVVTDSRNPQTLFCGTPPTPLSSGTVFLNLRAKVLRGETENTGWAEWGVDKVSDPNDRELWYLTNPSLGTLFTERSVADEIGEDKIDFNIQRLGLWLQYNQKSAISKTEWTELKVDKIPEFTGGLFVGIKYGNDGANVAVSVAVKTKDGRVFVDARDCQTIRNGNAWIISFLSSIETQAVVVDGASGQSILAAEMKDARLRPPILPTVKEVISANSAFEQAVYKKSICHTGQPSLTEVISNCDKRPIGSSGGFGYRSQLEDYDIALMDSAILAHWACITAKPVVKQKIKY